MKIEKKKVTGNAKLSTIEKGAIATMLGMSATFSLTACIGGAESGDVMGPIEGPESSNDTEILQSSSSQVDIPKSNEALSSSAIEALSSVAGPLSSSSLEPIIEAGVIRPYEDEELPYTNSSSATAPASSDTAPASSATSSSDTAPASSSINEKPEIRVETIEPEIIIVPKSSTSEPKRCDSTVEICIINEMPVMSMVTTFETTDLQA